MARERRALVVEGGALRGAFAVGVLRVLYDHGGPDEFDAIFAVSSGVFAPTYFAAGQVEEMENTWRNLVHGKQLINYCNVLRGKPILDLDYLIQLFKGPVRLDLHRVMRSSSELWYVLTDYVSGRPAYLNAKRPDIFELMKASSAVPILYPIPVFIDGHPYFDGSHSDPIPVERAISEGYSRILAVLTRPNGYVHGPSLRSRMLSYFSLRGSPRARREFLKRHEWYNRSLRIISFPPQGVTIHVIRPKHLGVSRLERSRAAIISAIEHGKKMAEEYLAQHGGIFG